MVPSRLGLSSDLFATAFPFHLAFDRDMRIVQVGGVLRRLCPKLSRGSQPQQLFEISRPHIQFTFEAIREQSQSLFILKSLDTRILLKGQMLADDRRGIIFFLCSPWLTDLESAADLGLSLDDFAIHDPVADFLFLLRSKTTALSDANRLATKLRAQGEELQKARSQLEARVQERTGELSAANALLKEEITERKRAEEALRESEERFRVSLMNSPVVVFNQDSDLRYTWLHNPVPGFTVEGVLGKTDADLLPAEEASRLTAIKRQVLHSGVGTRQEIQATVSGQSLFHDLAIEPLRDTTGTVVGITGASFDITERKGLEEALRRAQQLEIRAQERRRTEDTLRHLAHHDALTDLPNRTLFKDRLTLAMAQARRNEQMLAVMFLDLDRFKLVNDSAGHSEGDELLKIVSRQLKKLAREGDTVARLGGDEFVLLLPEIARVGDAIEIAQRILESFRQPSVLAGHEFHITPSIGITIFPADGDDAETLLTNADIAMYHAKEQGRNNYQFYTPALNASILERLALENDLRHGLEREEFVVYYQPQVNISTGQIVGVEALLRWRHPDRGLVMPMEFIPVADETGLIVPLGEWVLRTACAQAMAWQDAGLSPLRMAVNLSSRQFQQRDLAQKVRQVLQETGLDPHCLQLEITEGVAIQDVDYAIMMLRHLKELGVQIAIDDFGTGYSSLSYLRRLPIDVVKLDQSFIRDLTTNRKDAEIAATVIAMAHNLDLDVIAEGVETEQQRAFLKQRACDEMQGYLFSRPVPAEELEEILVQEASSQAA